MRLPTQLLRNKKNVHKNTFGHVLILAGSQKMLGAAALSSLAALRTGCGLVTIGTPKSLNLALQKKISNEIMTLPLPETKEQTLSFFAFKRIEKLYSRYNAIALGPGLSLHPSTKKLIYKVIETSPIPLVIDADALNALAQKKEILLKSHAPLILTPHPGEMARLTQFTKSMIEKDRKKIAKDFACKYNCILLLKGHQTIVASKGRIFVNQTGNPGMATAGNGDVLTGIISALLAQNLSAFESAKYGAFLHGTAGDITSQEIGMTSLIASDIIEKLPQTIKSFQRNK